MKKTGSKWYSKPLMKQNIRSNIGLTIVIVIVMILMSSVINYAMSMLSKEGSAVTEETEAAKEDFYAYLFAISTFNQATGAELSYEDFAAASEKEAYENAFQMISMQSEETFTVGEFEQMGVGVEELGIFNKLTLIGLYDIKSISTMVTDEPDYAFVWKLAVLLAIAVVTYVVGAVRFEKKDLPL